MEYHIQFPAIQGEIEIGIIIIIIVRVMCFLPSMVFHIYQSAQGLHEIRSQNNSVALILFLQLTGWITGLQAFTACLVPVEVASTPVS